MTSEAAAVAALIRRLAAEVGLSRVQMQRLEAAVQRMRRGHRLPIEQRIIAVCEAFQPLRASGAAASTEHIDEIVQRMQSDTRLDPELLHALLRLIGYRRAQAER